MVKREKYVDMAALQLYEPYFFLNMKRILSTWSMNNLYGASLNKLIFWYQQDN